MRAKSRITQLGDSEWGCNLFWETTVCNKAEYGIPSFRDCSRRKCQAFEGSTNFYIKFVGFLVLRFLFSHTSSASLISIFLYYHFSN